MKKLKKLLKPKEPEQQEYKMSLRHAIEEQMDDNGDKYIYFIILSAAALFFWFMINAFNSNY